MGGLTLDKRTVKVKSRIIGAHVREKSNVDEINMYRLVARYWGPALADNTALAVVIFMVDRTYSWGKSKERITYDQIVNGVYDENVQSCWNAGVFVSRSKVATVLSYLVEVGAVTKSEGKNAQRLSYSLNENWDFTMYLKLSKKHKEAVTRTSGIPKEPGFSEVDIPKPVHSTDQTSPPHGLDQSTPWLLRERKKENETKRVNNNIGSPPIKSIKEALDQGAQKQKAALAKRAERGFSSLTFFDDYWLPAMREHWPMAPVTSWTAKQRGKVRQLDMHWVGPSNTKDFLLWCVEAWARVNATKFVWVENVAYPEYPDIDFLIYCRKAFMESYGRRNELEGLINASQEDKIANSLKRQGFSAETVKERVGHVMAKRAEENKAVSKIQEAAMASKVAEQKLLELRRAQAEGAAKVSRRRGPLVEQDVASSLDGLDKLDKWK